jgi:formamidopyrimidine-DNA glycosylase
MPEMPEVEALARTVRPLVRGKRITRCDVIHEIAVRPSSGRGAKQAAERLRNRVHGQKIEAVDRRGKFLLLQLGDGGCVALHFRLSGKLLWFASSKISGHVDVAFELGKGTLGFVDGRHLGRVQWSRSIEEIPGIAALGVDPLSREFTAVRLAEMLAASRQPLKLFLLDQGKIAGLGNIYSSEAMWRARLSPLRPANKVRPAEARALHKGIVAILRRAIECCLDPAPDIRDPKWWFAGVDSMLRVYGREGKPCRRDGHPIRRIAQGGRSTFWCAHCQL